MDDKLYHGPMHGGPHFHSGPPGKRGVPGVSPKFEVGEVEDGNIPITVTDGYGQRTTNIPIDSVVTDERLTEKVDDWLDDHPEATTTVEDGSITINKFHNSVVDDTLTQRGHPADAVAVKTKVDGLDNRLVALENGAPGIIAPKVTEWLEDNVNPVGSAVTVDSSLTVAGSAADAKKTGDELSNLKSDITKTNADLHSSKNEIQPIQYSIYKVVDGKLIRYHNPSGLWKTIIAPIDCIYIDGVATLKTGGLSGVEAQDIPSMAFIDENWNVLSAIYTTIAPPHTFSIDDVPDGSAYVVGQLLNDNFTFAFQSTDNRISIISNSVDSIESEVAEIKAATTTDVTTDVALTFESATGFYNKSGGFDTYDGVTKAVVNVSEGEKYRLTAQNYYNAAVGVYLDGSDNYVSSLWYASGDSAITNKEVIVPSGVSKLMIQRLYNYSPIELKKVVGLKALPVKSVLSEKKISVIGDSITEKNFRAKTNWVLWLTDWCGATFQNLGRSGTGFRAGYNQSKNYYSRIASIQANPDVIGVAVSFNDISNPDVALGTITDTTANDTVAGYANDFFDALITAYPTTPIICYVQNPWWAFHYGVARSDAWIELMAEICAIRGIPFYSDLYKGCTLKPWLLASRQEYFTSDDTDGGSSGVVDDTHPNSEGHKVIARYLYPKFAENLVTTGLNYKG